MVGCFQVATTCKTVADPEVVELDAWEDWTPEMQMHYALFKITTSPQGDPSELMVHHKVCKTKATGSDYSANTGNRTTALQDLVLGGPDLGENLIEAMEPSAPEQPEIGSAESLDKLVFPRLNAFRCLVQHSDGFDEAPAEDWSPTPSTGRPRTVAMRSMGSFTWVSSPSRAWPTARRRWILASVSKWSPGIFPSILCRGPGTASSPHDRPLHGQKPARPRTLDISVGRGPRDPAPHPGGRGRRSGSCLTRFRHP